MGPALVAIAVVKRCVNICNVRRDNKKRPLQRGGCSWRSSTVVHSTFPAIFFWLILTSSIVNFLCDFPQIKVLLGSIWIHCEGLKSTRRDVHPLNADGTFASPWKLKMGLQFLCSTGSSPRDCLIIQSTPLIYSPHINVSVHISR